LDLQNKLSHGQRILVSLKGNLTVALINPEMLVDWHSPFKLFWKSVKRKNTNKTLGCVKYLEN